jgi:hypothetical protein
MALQRNLKALGTFGFQTTSRANPVVHPVHAADAELRARQSGARIRAFARLRELLAEHLEELR